MHGQLEDRYRWVHEDLNDDPADPQPSIAAGQRPGWNMAKLLNAGWEPLMATPSPVKEGQVVVLMRRPAEPNAGD